MLALVVVVCLLAWVLSWDIFLGIFEVLGAAVLIAQRSLADHVSAVADALRVSLAEGRGAVARIVGRDPETLDQAGVSRAAIESAAENFSDGVVAPVFWFLVGGLPGIAIYNAVNTAATDRRQHAGNDILAAIINDHIGPGQARVIGLGIAGHRGDNPGAGPFCQLNGIVTNSTGTARDQ